MEIWKDIAGYEGLYQVSNLGRVKSLDRAVHHKRLGTTQRIGKFISSAINSRGYAVVTLHRDGTKKTLAVHRLVAVAFFGEHENMEVNHIDQDRTNNCLDNLEWVTHLANMHHGDLLERAKSAQHKKPVSAYDDEGNIIGTFESMGEAARNGFHASAISAVIKGKRKTHCGFVWKLAK